MTLWQLPNSIHHTTAHQTEVTRIQRDIDGGQLTQQSVERPVAESLDWPFLTILANRVDHVVSLAHLAMKIEQQFRRVLQVTIENPHGFPGGMVQAGRNGPLMPEVSRQNHTAKARISLTGSFDQFGRSVRTAIVYQNGLARERRAVHRFAQALLQLAKHRLFIEDGNDEAEFDFFIPADRSG